MSTAAAVACFADRALQKQVTVVENAPMARDTYRIRIECPEIAQRIVPGQFIMLRLAGCDDPLLARPLALYDTVLASDGEPVGFDIVYLVMGKMTTRLTAYRPGQMLDIWGPLGNGFPMSLAEHLIMVAGGIGQTPFMAVGREYLGLRRYGSPVRHSPKSRKVTLCYGARSADYLAGVEDFSAIGVEVRLSTDDGSAGRRGYVTEVLQEVLEQSAADISAGRARIVCCGPERMMEAVAHIAHQTNVPCQVSLETPMACGIGICFSCVTKVRQPDGGWDYRRTCVEGPVFDAKQIVW